MVEVEAQLCIELRFESEAISLKEIIDKIKEVIDTLGSCDYIAPSYAYCEDPKVQEKLDSEVDELS